MKKVFVILSLVYSFDAFSKPVWIEKPDEYCKQTEICAVGSGESISKAKADARAEIMKYFKSNIKSRFISSEIVRNDDIFSSAADKVVVDTDGILEGVDIKEIYDDDKLTYALASFDKVKAANIIRLKISELDDEMVSLLNQNSRETFSALDDIFNNRKMLNYSYQFLLDDSIPEIVKYDDILSEENSFITKNEKFFIELKSDSDLKNDILSVIKDVLTARKNEIVENKMDATRILVVNLSENKEYLNVEGFEKYSMSVDFECSKDDKNISSLSFHLSNTGRNLKQIRTELFKQITDKIKNELYL